MGIVNVTPDSFSDGGATLDPADAVAAARAQAAAGAAIVDVGGESTRPGADSVPVDEELRRVVPVLEQLAGEVPLSIDTAKAEVARRALELGAELVNDVTALRGDPAMAETVASAGAAVCLMHMQGEPRTMQREPRYGDVASDVAAFLEERLAAAVDAGIGEERVLLDPGIGFGKTVEQNFELVRRLDVLARARPSGGRRLLAEELARPHPRRPGGPHRLRLRERRRRGGRVRARRNRAPRPRRARDGRGADRRSRGLRGMTTIELRGLELHGRHGVLAHEREHGQRFLFDLELDVPAPERDAIDATVDYRDVAAAVREVSDGRDYVLLETLAAAVAETLLERFPASRVRVRVRKPDVELDPPVAESAVSVEVRSS